MKRKSLTLRNMALVTIKRLPGGAVAVTGRKLAGGRANPGGRKSAFSLWGPRTINGYRKWGVNEKRKFGVYTVGPHDGYHTRAEASELLREKRAGERLPPYDPRA